MILAASVASNPPALGQTSMPDPATVKAERVTSTRALVLCQISAVKRLDDRKSDPATIARSMMSACGKQFDENVRVHSRYLTDGSAGQQKVAKALRVSSLDGAVQIVLRNRQIR
jgi:hypothetical protein